MLMASSLEALQDFFALSVYQTELGLRCVKIVCLYCLRDNRNESDAMVSIACSDHFHVDRYQCKLAGRRKLDGRST